VFDLSGRVAVVTGAGQGVGAGIAKVLAEAGADVCVNDFHADRAERVAAEIGGRATPFDVTDLDGVKAAVAAIGPVDILVNNAGIPPSMRPVQFSELDPAEWAPYVDVNLYGVLNCVKATIDGMYDRGFGRIITISSGAGQTGLGIGVSIYAAGKGAGISFMRHLAVESGRKGVTANTLALGLMQRATPAAEQDRTVTAGLERSIPVGRLGTGLDVGYACVYLASNEASWITGQTIGLNGGNLTQ
jgi:NAD(P)-dependent dehydrogenase (short-subunit alcohol dehydrogenase family)